jgi:UDP-N-acetylmuramoyl-tripeptide--D-alanyl-D-alanine ligase
MSMATLAALAGTLGGRLHGPDAAFDSVSTDTRTLEPGQLFFALKGPHSDGVAYVGEAARRGAVGAVVTRHVPGTVPQVEVPNTRLALGQFARAWRQQFSIPLVGITGTNGKTTVKEMVASILRAQAGSDEAVLVTWGNLNNEVGLPLTLLWLRPTHRAAVIEMGAARRGDIAYLAEIAAPTVAVVTNAGRAHLAGFGSVEDVAQTKGEIFAALAANGTAVINRDDRFFPAWWECSAGRRRVTFGLHASADFRADDVSGGSRPPGAGLSFRLVTPEGSWPVRLAMAGQHNVLNALAAAAAASTAGASPEAVVAGLEAMHNVKGRLRQLAGLAGCTVFDDTYNANPGSVRAAIDFLASLPGERVLVLGDMAELGPDSPALHREMGEHALHAGIDRLFCTGTEARAAAEAFGAQAEWYSSQPALIAALQPRVHPGLVVLVKGSRCMAMENIVQALAAEPPVQGS